MPRDMCKYTTWIKSAEMCSPDEIEPKRGKAYKHVSSTSINSATKMGHEVQLCQRSGNHHFDVWAFKATSAPDSLWPNSRCINVKLLNCFMCQGEQSVQMRVYFTTNIDHKFQACCGDKGSILTAYARVNLHQQGGAESWAESNQQRCETYHCYTNKSHWTKYVSQSFSCISSTPCRSFGTIRATCIMQDAVLNSYIA